MITTLGEERTLGCGHGCGRSLWGLARWTDSASMFPRIFGTGSLGGCGEVDGPKVEWRKCQRSQCLLRLHTACSFVCLGARHECAFAGTRTASNFGRFRIRWHRDTARGVGLMARRICRRANNRLLLLREIRFSRGLLWRLVRLWNGRDWRHILAFVIGCGRALCVMMLLRWQPRCWRNLRHTLC